MKKQVQPAETQDFDYLKTLQANKLLKHVASPLEYAVIQHSGKPFRYKIGELFIPVLGAKNKQLLNNLSNKIGLVETILKEYEVYGSIPHNLRKTFEDPAIILSLKPYLRNRLCELECYSLFTILLKGRDYFINVEGFGKNSIQALDSIFKKYGTTNLFK